MVWIKSISCLNGRKRTGVWRIHKADQNRTGEYEMYAKSACRDFFELGKDLSGNMTRMKNAIVAIPGELEFEEQRLETAWKDLEAAKEEVAKPFPKEEEFQKKQTRLMELDALFIHVYEGRCRGRADRGCRRTFRRWSFLPGWRAGNRSSVSDRKTSGEAEDRFGRDAKQRQELRCRHCIVTGLK